MKRTAVLAVFGLVVSGALVASPAIGATSSWTAITSPVGAGKPWIVAMPFDGSAPMQVSGLASADITEVKIYCFYSHASDWQSLADHVPVTAGQFSTPISAQAGRACDVRAVPQSLALTVPNVVGVGSYSGPTLLSTALNPAKDGNNKVKTYFGTTSNVAGSYTLQPAFSGVLYPTLNDPATNIDTLASATPLLQIPSGVLVVDGHHALLPGDAHDYASTPSAVPNFSVKVKAATNGDVTVTESGPVTYCADSDPPVPTCTVVPTGVAFKRIYRTLSAGTQLSVRDSFTDTVGKSHTVGLSYLVQFNPDIPATPGLAMPTDAKIKPLPDSPVTYPKQPVGPHTIRLVKDLHITDGTIDQADSGLTYSGAPKTASYLNTVVTLSYARKVPAHRSATFSFIHSMAHSLKSAAALSKSAQRQLSGHLTIARPARGAVVHAARITIKGKVTDAANGNPTKVKVTSGSHHRTTKVSRSGHWSTTLPVSRGKHTIVISATDLAGNRLHAKVKIRRA